MPKVKPGLSVEESVADRPHNELVSVIYGALLVCAIIVTGAALLGGSLGQIGPRWSGAVDSVSRTAGLSLKKVELIGLEHLPETSRRVRLATMIEPGENMFRADPHEIQRRIEATGLVSQVSVYRLWPDTVMIYAQPAQPVAIWQNGTQQIWVDHMGRAMKGPVEGPADDLLKVVSDDVPSTLPVLVQALNRLPGLKIRLDHVRRVGARRWDLILANGMIIQLPEDAALPQALGRLAKLDSQTALTSRVIDRIDLRQVRSVYLKPQTSTSLEEAA